jgi:hypothetical protein
VYTWGCSDNGSLGRSGDEYTPLLVQVSGVMRDSGVVMDMILNSAEYCGLSTTFVIFTVLSHY